MSAAISAHGVGFSAGRAILLENISLSVAGGETVALVGPNGAGKSTLIRVLSGELRPASGEVRLGGQPLNDYHPRDLAKRRIMLAQSIALTFAFTVEEVVRMGAGDHKSARVDREIEAALAAVDMSGYRGRIITTLSGGEQQRVHFARVLVQLTLGEEACGLGILMLDEPTASLDLRHQLDLLRIARARAANGTAVIAILHDLNLATMFADRIVMLERGRIVADGIAAETITDDMLEQVFKVTNAVGRVPASGVPFVLPHSIR